MEMLEEMKEEIMQGKHKDIRRRKNEPIEIGRVNVDLAVGVSGGDGDEVGRELGVNEDLDDLAHLHVGPGGLLELARTQNVNEAIVDFLVSIVSFLRLG